MNILVVYPIYPEPDKTAGACRIVEILKCLLRGGHRVTLLADGYTDSEYRLALEQLGVVCADAFTSRFFTSNSLFETFCRQGAFDVCVLSYYSLYAKYAPYLRAFLPLSRLIFDTVDLHFVRLERQAELTNKAEDRRTASEARREETRCLQDADQVWVVADVEQQLVQRMVPAVDVRIVPLIHEVHAERPPFDARSGIVFLGGYTHAPNLDAVHFFLQEVAPLLRRQLPDVPITIAGSHAPAEILNYANPAEHVAVPGFVQDHRALLAAHRVGVAPLRFGAGIKGKIGEYLACGLPCVTTSIGAEGMHLRHEQEALIADGPAAFAAAVARLYTERILWERLATAGIVYLESRATPRAVEPMVLAAVHAATHRDSRSRGQRLRKLSSLLNPLGVVSKGRHTWNALRKGGLRELLATVRVWSRRDSS